MERTSHPRRALRPLTRNGSTEMKKKATIITLSIALISTAYSYCVNDYKKRSVQEEFQSSQCVLIVKVESKANISDEEGFWSHQKYELSVLKRFKGTCPDKLTCIDENDSARFYMEADKQYLVFIEDMTSIDIHDCCGNSGLLADKKAVVEKLNKLSNHSRHSIADSAHSE